MRLLTIMKAWNWEMWHQIILALGQMTLNWQWRKKHLLTWCTRWVPTDLQGEYQQKNKVSYQQIYKVSTNSLKGEYQQFTRWVPTGEYQQIYNVSTRWVPTGIVSDFLAIGIHKSQKWKGCYTFKQNMQVSGFLDQFSVCDLVFTDSWWKHWSGHSCSLCWTDAVTLHIETFNFCNKTSIIFCQNPKVWM